MPVIMIKSIPVSCGCLVGIDFGDLIFYCDTLSIYFALKWYLGNATRIRRRRSFSTCR